VKTAAPALCGSVQPVQKAARPAGGRREISRFYQVFSDWHVRCINGEKLNRGLTKMTGLPSSPAATLGGGRRRGAPSPT